MIDREQLVDELFAQAVALSRAEREQFLATRKADANLDAAVLDGTLSGADVNKPDELAKEIAKCDAALKR